MPAAPRLVDGDRPRDLPLVSWSRSAFLAVGLLPTFWLMRRMPIGFFYMFGFWTALGSAVLLVGALIWQRREPRLRKVVPVLIAGIPIGLLLLAMIGVSRADARGERLPLTDTQVRALALAGQAGLAIWVARRTRHAGHRVVELVVVYAAALATISIRVTVGQNLPAWWFVPLVAVIAVRMATLPDAVAPRPGTDSSDGGFVPVLFVVALLMPSLAGARYLLEIGFRHEPVGLALEGGRPVTGGYQRWYATTLADSAAIAAVNNAFRVPPVSAWPDDDGHGVTGLLFGYRIESRYNPEPGVCRAGPGCVVVTVRRSTD